MSCAMSKDLSHHSAVARGFTRWLAAKGGAALRQALEEGSTEFAQTFVERAAVDYAHANRGELDKIKLTTAEGVKETLMDALNAAAAGNLLQLYDRPFALFEVGQRETGETEEEQLVAYYSIYLTFNGPYVHSFFFGYEKPADEAVRAACETILTTFVPKEYTPSKEETAAEDEAAEETGEPAAAPQEAAEEPEQAPVESD